MNLEKGITFSVSLVGTLVYFSLVFSRNALYHFCFSEGHCLQFWNALDLIGPLIFFFPFVFFFSLVTYLLHEKIFRTWFWFACRWIPTSIVLIFLAASSSGGGMGIPNVFDQEFIAIIFTVLFSLISLLIILVQSVRVYWLKK